MIICKINIKINNRGKRKVNQIMYICLFFFQKKKKPIMKKGGCRPQRNLFFSTIFLK